METIAARLATVQQHILVAEKQFHRTPRTVKLLAVSKGQPLAKIHAAIAAGQKYFGENYLQEALPKVKALKNKNLEWHFIGTIQANKTKAIAENFDWVESVTRIKIAQRLNEQRPADLSPLNVCIEVNISEEKNKSGIVLSELLELASEIKEMHHLKLRGLMAIPAPAKDFAQQRIPYRKFYQIFQTLRQQGFALDTLSMGMSNDFAAAIAEGSTEVRIGTAIFGPR